MLKNKGIIAIAGCIAAAAMSVCMLVSCSGDKKESSSKRAADMLEPTEATEPAEPEYPTLESFSEEPRGLTGLSKYLLTQNKDVVGYMKLSNTKVDYPVVQWPDSNDDDNGNAYYLDKDLYGNYLDSGTLFLDYRANYDGDPLEHSDHLCVYGHNMRSGAMFGNLKKYYQDESFYDENPIIEFSSNYKDYQYIIIAYFVTSGEWNADFRYWDIVNFETEDDYNYFIDTIESKTQRNTDVDVQYGDKFLTLSTCHLDVDNSRFLVVARRLRDDETPEKIDKKSSESDESQDSETAGE